MVTKNEQASEARQEVAGRLRDFKVRYLERVPRQARSAMEPAPPPMAA